jgi:phage-related tail fiber protein
MSRLVLNGLDLNGKNVSNMADGVSASDAVTLQQVQAYVRGLDWKDSVRAASTANVTVASALINGLSMDGVSLVTGNRVLLMNQTAPAENGIYVVAASGAASRATDADSSAEVTSGMAVSVEEGTANGNKAFQLTTDNPITLGTTGLTFSILGGVSSTYTADGNGLELSGSQFALELDGTTLTKGASGLRIGSGAAGAGLTEASGVLAVGQGTGISVAADAVAVDTSVVARKFSADCVVTTNPQTFTHSLGTKDVIVQVRRNSDDVLVETDVTAASTTTVSVNFGGAPTAAQYRVTVIG